MPRKCLAMGLLAASIATSFCSRAVDIEALKREVQRIREEIAHQDDASLSPVSKVDDRVFAKYGPNEAVTTRNGVLTVGGLVQIWYQHIQNDHVGIVTAAPLNNLDPTTGAGTVVGTGAFSGVPIPEPNEVLDNDTFRVRRTELRFLLDISENISGYIMIDPSREANLTFSPVPANPNHNAIFLNRNLRSGLGQISDRNQIAPQLLQDAYINFHDLVPHHEFQIGQFKPPSGEEAWRASGQLDFCDRSMITAINNVRDIGVMTHGGWWLTEKGDLYSGRFQYWIGAFNGPNGTVLTDPEIFEGGNRSDDNNDKDFCWRALARPVWDTKCWYGRLEIGYARTDGYRGESGHAFDPARAINSINFERTAIDRQAAWAWYRPNGPVKGWWFRGEWGSGHDNYSAAATTFLLGIGQLDPIPVTAQGWYFGTGYKVSNAPYASKLDKGLWCKALRNSEVAFRYETYQNVASEDVVNPDRRTDLFKTNAWTFGYNYYIEKYDARLQANYIIVDDPHEPNRGIREVKNNMFIINWQVEF